MAKTADFKVVIDSTWVTEHLAEWLQEERASAWWAGVNHQWEHRPTGNRVLGSDNPYRTEHNNA